MSKYHDDASVASHPGGVVLSDEKLKRFHPKLYTRWSRFLGRLPLWFPVDRFGLSHRYRDIVDEHVRLGDSRAALVMSIDPLLVAAYTDELDCVAILRFDPWVREAYNLNVGDRLLTVNTYTPLRAAPVASDLTFGSQQYGRYSDFWPIIAEFIAADLQPIRNRKSRIDKAEWQRTRDLAEPILAAPRVPFRYGAPLMSFAPIAPAASA